VGGRFRRSGGRVRDVCLGTEHRAATVKELDEKLSESRTYGHDLSWFEVHPNVIQTLARELVNKKRAEIQATILGGIIRCSYQLKQDNLCVDGVRDIIVISINFRGDDLGMITDDLGHADLHADIMPVTDSFGTETQGLTNALVVYVGLPCGKCASIEWGPRGTLFGSNVIKIIYNDNDRSKS